MRIEHVALWTSDLERARAFYALWFGATAGARYENPAKGFASYFLTLDGGARLELMQATRIGGEPPAGSERLGWAHIALALGSREAVDALTERMVEAGVVRVDGPRTTGDGYYESVVLDPDGNRIELTV